MRYTITLINALLIFSWSFSFAQGDKNIIKLGAASQKITYLPYTSKGDIIPDFSYCGYKAGGVSIAIPEIVKQLSPVAGDNTKHIQNALDSIGQLALDANGLRGTLLLNPGTYNIAKSLMMKYSGVTLMGAQADARRTVLVATAPMRYTLIEIGVSENPKVDSRSKRQVVADYVPSGTRILELDDVSPFRVGDAIIVERPSTEKWIAAIGMDKIEANWRTTKGLSASQLAKYEQTGKLSTDGKSYDSTVQWEPGSKNLKFERKIVSIDGNTITIDIPLTNALQKEFGGGSVYKYKYSKRVNEVGIANLSAISRFDSTVLATDRNVGEYFADEEHGWTFVNFINAEDSWADNVEATHFSFGFVCGNDSRFITIQNCSFIDPVSLITGGRRYAYNISGQQCLVYKSYARNGRHDFVMGAVVAGPNAFVDSKAELCHAHSEPHHRWSTGTLFDNCSLSGPNAAFSLSNRGKFGTGHGWSGAQMVLWNCTTPLAVVMKPPTAQNFSFGTVALTDNWSTSKLLQERVERLNKVSGESFEYKGFPTVGDGYIFSDSNHVLPRSLYFQQLKDRLTKE